MANSNTSGKFRKRKVTFAQVSNIALRDPTLSLKAKGLYSLIQSYITIEDFTLYKSHLMKQCVEKDTAFKSAWNELKKIGYLVQYKLKDEKTGIFYYEYDLLDEVKSHAKPVSMTDTSQRKHNSPQVDFPPLDSAPYGLSTYGEHTPYNKTYINDTNLNNTNPSINQNKNDGQMDLYEQDELKLLKEQIDFNSLKERYSFDIPLLEEIQLLIKDMFYASMTRISGELKGQAIIRGNLSKLRYEHIENVLLGFKEVVKQQEIKNVSSYLKTMVYMAPMSMNLSIKADIGHKMGL